MNLNLSFAETLSLALSLIAVIVAIWAVWYSRRAAKAAEIANEIARERMRIEAAEKEKELSEKAVVWEITREGNSVYVLRNVGHSAAHNVLTINAGSFIAADDLPDGVTIEPGQGHIFSVTPVWAPEKPTSLELQWQWQGETKTGHAPIPS